MGQMGEELKKHIKAMDDAFYGLTTRDICSLVFEFCSKNKIPRPFNQVKQSAGRDFIYNFLKRHPDLSLRKPQGISINRILGCNKENVQRYFLNLNQLLDENDFSPHQIYNCDKTGITTVCKQVKVIAKKGKKSVFPATCGERGVTTTVFCACNATGYYIPPMMILNVKQTNRN